MNTRPRVARLCVEELESRVVPSAYDSTNWSGYAVSSGADTVTAVSGSWVVPQIQSGSPNGYSSSWVGIDGFSSSSVEQIGTDSDKIGGTPHYYAWWEVYPNPSKTISTLTIHPGDTISASVTYTGSSFQLKITDNTTSISFSTTQSYSSAQRSSAEWIEEAPSSYSGVLPLSDFGTIHFSNAQATIGGATGQIDNSAWSSEVASITMVTNSGALKDKISGLTDSGSPTTSSFSVTWVSSGSGSRGGGGGGHGGGREPLVSLTQPLPTTIAALSGIGPSGLQAFSPTPQATSSAATFTPAPTSQALPFSPAFTTPVNVPLVSGASVSGPASPLLLPQAFPDASDSAMPPVSNGGSDETPPPAVLPIPPRDNQDNMQASAPNEQALMAEGTSALISESEQEPSPAGDA